MRRSEEKNGNGYLGVGRKFSQTGDRKSPHPHGFCANVTLNVFIPRFPIGQVHVDVGTQLRAAAAENSVDFVLIKSSFLSTEPAVRPRPLLTRWLAKKSVQLQTQITLKWHNFWKLSCHDSLKIVKYKYENSAQICESCFNWPALMFLLPT